VWEVPLYANSPPLARQRNLTSRYAAAPLDFPAVAIDTYGSIRIVAPSPLSRQYAHSGRLPRLQSLV